MPKKLKTTVFLVIFMFLGLSGCSTISGYPNTSKADLPSNSDSIFLFSDEEYKYMIDETTRNNIIHKRIRDIDLAYSEFEANIYKENISFDLSTDIAVLALSGGTVIAGGAETKEALAAITTFILGSKASFDKKALLENTMAILVKKMRADRAQVRNDILLGTKQLFSYYDAGNASIDIARYYYSGTIPSALTGLAKVSVDEETRANETHKKIINDQFMSDPARKCLISYWKPNNVIDANHQNELTTWIKNSKYNNMKFGLFLNGSSAAKARIDAANYLIVNGKIDNCPL
ncbi:hypothetical protein [Aeromonas schubertii]|uniref:hypothetical protein n=1 Tax=Aeromonas schubertii TaxID=652 RepID=UPI0010A82A85|nr:hypothetical protein [Aeromonas schubertii]QCG48977.1 hypothetical protein E2P79_15110 [Aeromonas schubertii]